MVIDHGSSDGKRRQIDYDELRLASKSPKNVSNYEQNVPNSSSHHHRKGVSRKIRRRREKMVKREAQEREEH